MFNVATIEYDMLINRKVGKMKPSRGLGRGMLFPLTFFTIISRVLFKGRNVKGKRDI